MAAADPIAQIRYRVSYVGPFNRHNMLFHSVGASSLIDLRTGVAAIITAMASCVWETVVFDRAETAEAGSPFYFPDPAWTSIPSTTADNPSIAAAPSQFVQWGGRSPFDGRRVKWYLFESIMGNSASMRLAEFVNSAVDAVTNALQDNGDVVGTISGSQYVVYRYANLGQNDLITHNARQ
jgi:hypothetical protein